MKNEASTTSRKKSGPAKAALPRGMTAAKAFEAAFEDQTPEKHVELLAASLAVFEMAGVAPPKVPFKKAKPAFMAAIEAGSAARLRLLLDAAGAGLTTKGRMDIDMACSEDAKLMSELAAWDLAALSPSLFGAGISRASPSKIMRMARDPAVSGKARLVASRSDLACHAAYGHAGLAALSMLAKMGFDMDGRSRQSSFADAGAPALWAAQGGNVEGLVALEALGADVKRPGILSWAVSGLHLEAVEHALARGCDPDGRGSRDCAPLRSLAGFAFAEHQEPGMGGDAHARALGIARALLDAGADPCVQESDGTTPLMVAAWSSSSEMVQLLLDAGADPSPRDSRGLDAAGWAVRSGAPRHAMAAMIRAEQERSILSKASKPPKAGAKAGPKRV